MNKSEELFAQIMMFLNMGLKDEAKRLEEEARLRDPDFWKSLNTNCETEHWLNKFITTDKEMTILKDDIRKCSSSDEPIMIRGETGTGKELLARALHGARKGKFVAINVTNLPSELLESELFGSVRGAFTGATDRVGLFQLAGEGTLFLDEIGDMPYELQAKLLRVLQDKRARKLGHNEEYIISARIVSATNSGLEKFRRDLYHRLSVIELHTKPLRERLGDIPMIVNSIDKEFPKDYNWNGLEGNVRSIQKIVGRL